MLVTQLPSLLLSRTLARIQQLVFNSLIHFQHKSCSLTQRALSHHQAPPTTLELASGTLDHLPMERASHWIYQLRYLIQRDRYRHQHRRIKLRLQLLLNLTHIQVTSRHQQQKNQNMLILKFIKLRTSTHLMLVKMSRIRSHSLIMDPIQQRMLNSEILCPQTT